MEANSTDYQQYINGEWVKSAAGQTANVLNPSTEEIVGTIANGNEDDALKALKAAEAASKAWAATPARQRAEILYAFTAEIKANRERLAKLLCQEQGKLFKVAQFEVDVTA